MRRSLVKAKRFHITTEICSDESGFHRVVSRQGILCSDRVLAKPRGFLVATEHFMSRQSLAQGKDWVATGFSLFPIEIGQGRRFYVTTRHFLSRQRELLVRAIPCRDRVYYVTTGNGGSIRFSVATRLSVSR